MWDHLLIIIVIIVVACAAVIAMVVSNVRIGPRAEPVTTQLTQVNWEVVPWSFVVDKDS